MRVQKVIACFLIAGLEFQVPAPALAGPSCSAVLGEYRQQNESLALAPTESPRSGQALAITPNHQLTEVINTSMERSLIRNLVQGEIIYSNFFTSIAESMGLVPARLAVMTPEQMNVVANTIYSQMEKAFAGDSRMDRFLEKLTNPSSSKTMFDRLNKAALIDKIGESLVLQASRGFFGLKRDETLLTLNQFVSGTLGFLATLAAVMSGSLYGAGAVGGAWEFGEYNALTSVFLGSSGVAAASHRIYKADDWFRSLVLQEQHLRLIRSPERLRLSAMSFYPTVQNSELMGRLETISSSAEQLRAGATPLTERTLLTYGTESLNLHAELVHTFVQDFIAWMKIYENHRTEIREKLLRILNGDSSSRENKSLAFLSQIFTEAAEATHLTHAASEKIVDLLKMSREELDRYQQENQLSSIQMIDWERRGAIIRTALHAHEGFQQTLRAVYGSISETIRNLDEMKVAETSRMIRTLGEQVSGNAVEQNTVRQILMNLDELDARINRIRATQQSE